MAEAAEGIATEESEDDLLTAEHEQIETEEPAVIDPDTQVEESESEEPETEEPVLETAS